MNLNDLAKEICAEDKGHRELDISQAKRIIRVLAMKMAEDSAVVAALLKYGLKKLEESL